ncbi:MAG: pantoate--beta-alanine ligase [Cryomorphaceae bacterium]|nr:pantoate--beta-alanine ligase [Cryomorphaceae bacterium]
MGLTRIHRTRESLRNELGSFRANSVSIGFVPTMGALHEGHLELMIRAARENDCVVVSIFVNPTQFNNQKDLEKYPRMLDRDVELLSGLPFECNLFAPEQSEIYPANELFEVPDLHPLDKVLEGKFRPGHFQGVAHVVHNLLRIVEPDRAYFGRKDLQQLAVIRRMSAHFQLPIEIVACETKREFNGLAMSSRNLRLTEVQKVDALILFETLEKVKEWRSIHLPSEVRKLAVAFFESGNLQLEYLEIVDENTFELLSDSWNENSACCIAAFCGEVRLIDNMTI